MEIDNLPEPQANKKATSRDRVVSKKIEDIVCNMYLYLQAKFRANRTKEERKIANQKQKEEQKQRRDNLTQEKKEAIKEKDRLRKQKKAQEKRNNYLCQEQAQKNNEDENVEEETVSKTPFSRSAERVRDKEYRRKVRKEMSEAEKEFERVYNLLQMRDSREKRNGKEHLQDNLKAKRGMRDLREKGRVIGKDFMMRGKREKDEEILWWSFWNKGKIFKDVLKDKKPETAEAMKEKEELLKKKGDDRKKIEDELDARGRWKLECDGEYYWSIPDENGVNKSLAQYEHELEQNEPKLSPEEEEKKKQKEEEKRKRDREMWKKYDEEMDRWYEQERQEKKAELARKQKERRDKKKAELLKPIKLPKKTEKGEYEKARDTAILERHNAMKASGMFGDKELKAMLTMIT